MVGKRVEGDVDLMVDGEMRLESRGPAKEVDPIWVDIALGKTVAELRLKRMTTCFSANIGYRLQAFITAAQSASFP